jgi:hypothetical protein
MLNAINNIYSISKLVEQSSDDQIIRAANTKLKTDDSIKTYFYVRNNKIDQVLQKLTDWTNGAKTKQALAKNQIILNLKIIKDDPEFHKKFPDQGKRERALVLMNKIIMNINTAEKDITASMIKKDLQSLNSFLGTYETIEKKSEHSDQVEDSSEGDVAKSEAESDLNKAKVNNTGSNTTEAVGVDLDDGLTVVMHPSELENFENNTKAIISKNISSYLSKLSNVTSIDVAEVILNSSDPTVAGKPVEETNSTEANSTPAINTTPAPIGKAIEQGKDVEVAATQSIPSPVTSAPSSTADTKSIATANPYLESLNTKWSAKENGYFEVSKPFYITGEMPTSKMLAQAYLLPQGKKLEFFGEKGEASKLNENQIVHGEHELRDDLDLSNQKRDSRTYLKLEVKSEMKSFQVSPTMASNPAVIRMTEEYKNSLKAIYKDSVEKISAEYKKTNSGKELETIVITPITSTEGILLAVESTALVSAVKEIQLGNPNLKIAISADKEVHSDAIRTAYEE